MRRFLPGPARALLLLLLFGAAGITSSFAASLAVTSNKLTAPVGASISTYLTPQKTTAPSAATIVAGQSALDIATLTGGTDNAGGTITFTLYTSSCVVYNGDSAFVNVTSGAAGHTYQSAPYIIDTVGTYYFTAGYSGDAATHNNAVAPQSPCTMGDQVVVSKASPTVTAVGPASGSAGTAISVASISSVFGASSGANVGGTINFSVFGPQVSAPSTCTSGGTAVGAATVAGNGTYVSSAGLTPSVAGSYWWYASYGGDTNNNAAVSTCGATMSKTVVSKASPTVTAVGPASGPAGTAISATSISSVFGASSGANVGGTINFSVFGPQVSAPSTCTSGGTAVGAATVAGNGTYVSSAGFTPSVAGSYWWYASYGGDTNNNAAVSTCGATMSKTVVTAPVVVTASLLKTATDTTGSSQTSTVTGVSTTSGATIVILVYREASASGLSISSISGTALSGSPTQIPGAAQTFNSNGKFAVWAWQGIGTGAGAGTVTVTFDAAKNTKTVIDVVQLSGNGVSPLTAHVILGSGSNSATASTGTMAGASSANGEIFFAGITAATTMSTPTGGFSALDAPGGNVVSGSWFKSAAQSTSVSSNLGANRDFGAIALEINHG